jgi:hypothetical protein
MPVVTFHKSCLSSNCDLFSQTDDLYAFVLGEIPADRRAGDMGLPMHEARDRVREQLRCQRTSRAFARLQSAMLGVFATEQIRIMAVSIKSSKDTG